MENPRTFYTLTTAPPWAICAYFLPPFRMLAWMGVWCACQALVANRKARSGVGHAITVYVAWTLLDRDTFTGDTIWPAAIGVGLVVGVAYRNALKSLTWLASDFPLRPEEQASDGRPAVTVPLQMSKQGGANGGIHLSGAPPNVHGNKVFTVKVQLPHGMGQQAASENVHGMVYDEKRSFQAFLNLESATHGATAEMVRLIATKGSGGGLKGYFSATRDEQDLRIYVDRLLKPPQW